MTGYQKVVRVHRRGKDPLLSAKEEVATMDQDGRLYVKCGDRWWRLSSGEAGWHSLNVGVSDPNLISRLDSRSTPIRPLRVKNPYGCYS